MAPVWIRIPGRDPVPFGEGQAPISFGRSNGSDVVLLDASVSRHHAQLAWKETTPVLHDLHSRNGCRVNGQRLLGAQPVKPGDEIWLGNVRIHLEAAEWTAPRFEDDHEPPGKVSFRMRVDKLQKIRTGPLAAPEAGHWREALAIVHELSLELMGPGPLDLMLWGLLDRLFSFLRPGRGVVLLRDAQGQLCQVAARSSSQGRHFEVSLSRTMVEAALEQHEAMLVNNPMQDKRLREAPSLMRSGVATIMTVPLEYEDEVVGLVYLDAGPTRHPFTEGELEFVASLGHLAAAKVQTTRLAEEVARKRDLEKEMAIARQIQVRILPDRMPEVGGFDLFGVNVPCKQVSGDLYGYWHRPDGKVWLAVADVSGKGLGPGLLMASFQAYLHAWSESFEDPAALALKLSWALSRKTTTNRFITAFLMLLDPRTGSFTYVNAGHNPALLLRSDGHAERLASQGFPLAMFPGKPYGQETRALQPGDLLFLYTDGITEAQDSVGQEFGLEGAEAVLRAHPTSPLPELYHELAEALDHHTQGASLADDRTILMVRRQGPRAR